MKRISMQKKNKSADIYLYDIIGDSWDGTTAKQFALDLKMLGEDLDQLNIFINSPGGIVWDGIAIFNTLVRHKAKKVMMVDGMAASIASVILMAGDEITIAKNGMVMIHNPMASIFFARAEEMREAADKLDKIREVLIETYTDRTGGKSTSKEIGKWMDDETWMDATESKARGFVDSISEKEIEIAALVKHDLAQFKNVPNTLAKNLAGVAGQGKPHPAIAASSLRLARMQRKS